MFYKVINIYLILIICCADCWLLIGWLLWLTGFIFLGIPCNEIPEALMMQYSVFLNVLSVFSFSSTLNQHWIKLRTVKICRSNANSQIYLGKKNYISNSSKTYRVCSKAWEERVTISWYWVINDFKLFRQQPPSGNCWNYCQTPPLLFASRT